MSVSESFPAMVRRKEFDEVYSKLSESLALILLNSYVKAVAVKCF